MPLFCTLSKRWETLFYLFSGVLINYCLRVNMSIAASEIIDDLEWSDYQKGLLLSSFFWGYSVGQLPSTLIAQRYGHKYSFGFAVLFSSLVTLFFPISCTISYPLALFTRALTGLMSSALFPSSYHFFPRWIPLSEKTLMISIFGSGMYMGEIIGFSISGYLVSTNPNQITINSFEISGWPLAFYFFGLIGLLWTPFYFWNVYGSPDEHPTITIEERHLIMKGLGGPNELKYETTDYYPGGGGGGNGSDIEDDDSEEGAGRGHDDEEGESNRLISHDINSIGSHRLKSKTSQGPADLRKRVSSIGGAIASESLYASSNIETLHSNDLPSTLPHHHHHQQHQYLQQTSSPLLSHDQLHNLTTSKQLSTASHKAMNDLTFSDIPWYAFATTSQALILFLCHWCYAFVGFILLTEIPAFLTEELDYDIESAGLLSIAPYAANFISTILFAMYFDRVEEIEGWPARKVRQRSMQITFLGAGGCLVICGFMKQREVAYFFLILSLFFFGANHSGIHCAYLDVSPNFSSIMNTIGNTCGAVAGLTGPLMVSAFTSSFPGSWGWQLSFLVVFGQCILTLILWAIFQSSDIIPALNTPMKHK